MIISILVYGLSALVLLFIIVSAASVMYSVISFAPWVPSRTRDLARIFKLADLKPGQVFYDLGCGDGRMVFYARDNFKARAIGLEISLPMFLVCSIKRAFSEKSNLEFKFKNLFKENLSAADVVYFFGMPKTINNKLSAKLKQELRPGTKVISYSFKLNDWTPKVIDKPTAEDLPVYLYIA